MHDEFQPYFLPGDNGEGEIVSALIEQVHVEFSDYDLAMLFRWKPMSEIQELFDHQISVENYEAAHQMKRVVNLLNSKVCKFHLQKPLILKVK